jgi:hypothetical protein
MYLHLEQHLRLLSLLLVPVEIVNLLLQDQITAPPALILFLVLVSGWALPSLFRMGSETIRDILRIRDGQCSISENGWDDL